MLRWKTMQDRPVVARAGPSFIWSGATIFMFSDVDKWFAFRPSETLRDPESGTELGVSSLVTRPLAGINLTSEKTNELFCCRLVLPVMLSHNRGKIINLRKTGRWRTATRTTCLGTV